jgi:hypothetical protein
MDDPSSQDRRHDVQQEAKRRAHQGNQHQQADQDTKEICSHLIAAAQNPEGQREDHHASKQTTQCSQQHFLDGYERNRQRR